MIQTNRLSLRPFVQTDLAALHDLYNAPGVLEHYLYDHTTLSETQTKLSRMIDDQAAKSHGLLATVLNETNRLIGRCGLLDQLDVDGIDELEIAYMLHTDCWGQGLATEAATAIRDDAFTRFTDREYLISLIAPNNKPSQRVATRIGMKPWKTVTRWGTSVQVFRVDRQSSKQA